MNHVLLENKEINKTHKINEIKRPNDKVNSGLSKKMSCQSLSDKRAGIFLCEKYFKNR